MTVQKKMLNLPIYSAKKLLLSFEYGIVMSDVAKERGFVLDKETVKRCEEIILNEFTKKNAQRVAIEMVPNILASFETK